MSIYVPSSEVEHRYRTIWLRIIALFIDVLLLSPLFIIIALIAGRSFTTDWLMTLSRLAVIEAYLIYFHGRYGQTPGKRAMKIIVLDAGGSRISYRQAILREAITLTYLAVITVIKLAVVFEGGDPDVTQGWANPIGYLFTGVGLIDILFVFANNHRRALHDYIARTVVVRPDVNFGPAGEAEDSSHSPPSSWSSPDRDQPGL